MIVAILQFELLIRGAESLKDKRRIVNSVKDRLHREHQVSVAEVGLLDLHSAARLGLAFVASDGRRAGQVLDAITAKLRALHDAELGDCSREIISPTGGQDDDSDPAALPADDELTRAVLRRAQEAGA